MVGTYIAFVCYSLFGLDPYVSWPFVIIGSIVFGSIIVLIVRKTIGGKDLNHILITLGISMILQNVVLMFFKSDVKSIPARFTTSINILGCMIPITQLIAFAIAAIATVLLLYVFNKTYWGRGLKAVGENRNSHKLGCTSVFSNCF